MLLWLIAVTETIPVVNVAVLLLVVETFKEAVVHEWHWVQQFNKLFFAYLQIRGMAHECFDIVFALVAVHDKLVGHKLAFLNLLIEGGKEQVLEHSAIVGR